MLYGWHPLDPNLRLHNTQYIPLKSLWLDICTLQLDLILINAQIYQLGHLQKEWQVTWREEKSLSFWQNSSLNGP